MSFIKKKDLKAVLKTFIDHTTVDGLSYIYDSSFIVIKLIWAVIFCAFLAFCSNLIFLSFDSYFSYQTVTSITHQRVNNIRFPFVTVCNLYFSTSFEKINFTKETKDELDVTTSEINEQIKRVNTFYSFYTNFESYLKFILLKEHEKIDFDFWDEMQMACVFMKSECNKSEI